jgi:hypothetical protein
MQSAAAPSIAGTGTGAILGRSRKRDRGWGTRVERSLAVVVLFGVALLGNLPLGFLRRRSRRWSLPWWIGCDGSVPVLWALRHTLDVDVWAIVPEILLALIGNVYGPRLILRLRRRPVPVPVAEQV